MNESGSPVQDKGYGFATLMLAVTNNSGKNNGNNISRVVKQTIPLNKLKMRTGMMYYIFPRKLAISLPSHKVGVKTKSLSGL